MPAAASRLVRVLGIDPGLRTAGYAIVDLQQGKHDPALVEAGVIRLKPRQPVPERLRHLYDDVRELIREFKPERLAVEAVFSHAKFVRTAIVMGHGRGVVLLAAAQAKLPIDELAPTEIKKALTGRGQASKGQMQRAVMSQFALRSLPEPPDVADAIGIAATAARRLAMMSHG